MSAHTLRPVASPEDWRALHDIRRAVLFAPARQGEEIVYDDNHPDDRDPHNTCFLLLFDAQPIGVVRLDARPPATGMVRLVAIVGELQRQGHGQELMRLIEGEARHSGMRRLMLNAHPDAVGFYERVGWSREEWDRRELTGIAASCVQMTKRL